MPSKQTPQQETPAVIRPGLPRIFEVCIAAAGLIVLLPILTLAALAVALTSRGPVFFRQYRVGLNGRTFLLYKLRTMRSSTGGAQVTAADDDRVTPVGKFLRKTKLDEIPQLLNVLKGEMSLVGPRPEVPRYVDEQHASWRFMLNAKPGIADPVMVRLRNEEELLTQLNGNREDFYIDVLQPYKLKGYEEYLRQRNWRTDVEVLVNTAIAVLLPSRFPPPTLDEVVRSAEARVSVIPTSSPAERSAKTALSWFRPSRLLVRQTQWALDILVLAASFLLAYLLRFEFAIPAQELRNAVIQLLCLVAIQFAALILTGVYAFVWRYVGMSEVSTFIKAALLASLPPLIARLALPIQFKQFQVPLSIIIMDTAFAFGGVLALRVARRAVHEANHKRKRPGAETGPKKAVLLIGAGRAGMIVVREILDVGNSDLDIKGFVDDDPNKQGSVIQGIRVMGTTQDLPRLVRKYNIDHIVISIAKATRQDFRRILDVCEQIPVKVRVMPGLYEILQGKVKVSRIRDLQIEDLLGREPVHLDEDEIGGFLVDKTVMVTGAGGSIGSELCRQVARFQPAKLLLVERAEFALFDIDREIASAWPKLSKVPLVADVSDRARMRKIFSAYRPEVVLHAAAHKHVPMMENNCTEALKNNVFGTLFMGDLAGEFGAEMFVLISTDKAVRPSSVMGATKRVAELAVQDLDRKYETRYVAVRFGNVIGSAGSVIPIFREQILKGGPVTVTHPDMARYFMTIPEAAQLVLQAGAMGDGGEIFILDMGEPVRILDLAEEAISLSGLRPYEDIEIVFSGVRPGEKLFEELETKEENVSRTLHPKIFIGKIAAYPAAEVRAALQRFERICDTGDETELRTFLNLFLPEARIDVSVGKKADTATGASGGHGIR
jgi:FlaA1/EpsC-like NDP-sugar epimerase/lipopolysaccharide/colanic/teichoic acid biosynthesis glycosyltransferase